MWIRFVWKKEERGWAVRGEGGEGGRGSILSQNIPHFIESPAYKGEQRTEEGRESERHAYKDFIPSRGNRSMELMI